MTILRLATYAGALLIASLLTMVAASHTAMHRASMNGPAFQHLVQSKDLIADILPPPKYIIEPYLEATLALNDPGTVEAATRRLDELRTEYDVRQSYWLNQAMDADLKGRLTERTHAPAKRFWSTLSNVFLPALRRGETAAAQAAYRDLTAAYKEHRAHIDELVAAASDSIAKGEKRAIEEYRSSMFVVWLASLFMLAVLLSVVASVIVRVVVPLEELRTTMAEMARGNLKVDVSFLDRRDEIGGMAKTLLVFKEAMFAKKIADEEAEANSRSQAYRDFRALEDWIKRDSPPFEEVQKRALELRRRYKLAVAA